MFEPTRSKQRAAPKRAAAELVCGILHVAEQAIQPIVRGDALRLNGGVMRVSASLLTLLLVGCASNPQPICAQLVSKDWTYIGRDASLDEQLSSELLRAPYYTNEGKRVGFLRRVWYRQGESRIMACTFGGLFRDSCSVSSTEFERHEGSWSKGGGNMVLCNVTL